jgi:cyclopropane fatty-acyl-phospholipid synthase-like methyltransferase
MGVAKLLYSFGYRHLRTPWDGGRPRKELVELVESGRIQPGKAIDLGSGTGWNCIFMAQHGFQVTGVDFAPGAIELGRRRAAEAGVVVNWIEDDLTDLRHVTGRFDLLVDYGTFDDLAPKDRELYLQNVLPLTRPGSRFLLYCFEWQLRWWERLLPLRAACEPGEIARRFGPHFEIERYAGGTTGSWLMPAWAVYLMSRKDA